MRFLRFYCLITRHFISFRERSAHPGGNKGKNDQHDEYGLNSETSRINRSPAETSASALRPPSVAPSSSVIAAKQTDAIAHNIAAPAISIRYGTSDWLSTMYSLSILPAIIVNRPPRVAPGSKQPTPLAFGDGFGKYVLHHSQ
jgi:hypothetical protein